MARISTSGESRNSNSILKTSHKRDVFYFAHTRTASHVLCRQLSSQPDWIQSDYHFFDAFNFARDTFGWGPLANVPEKDLKDFETLLQKGFDEIQADRRCAANKNRAIFLKEHAFYVWEPARLSQSMWGGARSTPFTVFDEDYPAGSEKTNPTIFPDRFLLSWRPIFLIRHPALSFESWYRAESGARSVDIFDKSWAFYTTFQYCREVYDWYLSKNREQESMPIVLEADDMLVDDTTINKLAELLGMDTQYILNQWDAIGVPDDANSRQKKFMSGYWNSTSIDRSKTSRGLNMAARFNLWEDEFGRENAAELRRLVEKAMPDYEYLSKNKL